MIWAKLAQPRTTMWALAGLLSLIVAIATAQGIGVTPDSVTYLRLADRFAKSQELHVSVPWVSPTHFPPGWSILVGFVSWTSGLSVLEAARLVNVLAAGALLVVLARAMTRPGERLSWSAVIGSAWIALLYQLYRTSINALTEPTFLILCILALLALERFEEHQTSRLLLLSASLIAGATLVRYVGVTLLVPLGWSVARLDANWIDRLRKLSWSGAVAVGPVALWILAAPASSADPIHSASNGGTADLDDAVQSLASLVDTLIRRPSQIGIVPLAIAIFLLAVVAAAMVIRDLTRVGPGTTRPEPSNTSAKPWVLFASSYLLLVAAQRWWIDREIIARYWLPVVAALAIVGVRSIDAWISTGALTRSTTRLLLAAALVGTTWNLAWAVRIAEITRSDGIGYNRVVFETSQIIATLRSLEDTEVLTDNPSEVFYHAPSLSQRDLMLDRVRDFNCRDFDWEAVESAKPPTAIALLWRCDQESVVDRLEASLPGVTVIREPGVGTLFLWVT